MKKRKEKSRRLRKHQNQFNRKKKVPKFRGPYSEERFSNWIEGLSDYDVDQVAAEVKHSCIKKGWKINEFADLIQAELNRDFPARDISGRQFKIETAKRAVKIYRSRTLNQLHKIEKKFAESETPKILN